MKSKLVRWFLQQLIEITNNTKLVRAAQLVSSLPFTNQVNFK